MRNQYVTQCVDPVAKRAVPERGCAFRLFESLERRRGTHYTPLDAWRQGDEFFRQELNLQLRNAMTDPVIKKWAKPLYPEKGVFLNAYLERFSLFHHARYPG
jgi:hypothetical protein